MKEKPLHNNHYVSIHPQRKNLLFFLNQQVFSRHLLLITWGGTPLRSDLLLIIYYLLPEAAPLKLLLITLSGTPLRSPPRSASLTYYLLLIT